jgi:hypothetical protein
MEMTIFLSAAIYFTKAQKHFLNQILSPWPKSAIYECS